MLYTYQSNLQMYLGALIFQLSKSSASTHLSCFVQQKSDQRKISAQSENCMENNNFLVYSLNNCSGLCVDGGVKPFRTFSHSVR